MAVELGNARQTPALEAVDRELGDLATGANTRLMVFMAPQEGKSSRVSCWYPLWRLALDPSLRIGIVSYASNKAERWGRWIRRMIRAHPELGITLMQDSRAVDRFETTAGGMVISVGIEGGITGEPVDEMVIDDPVRGRAEAESPTYRDRAWDWWESNGSTRASARFKVILMMTRWHSDDLAGRLLVNEPGEWRVLRIPAIQEDGIEVRGYDGANAYHPNGELVSVRQRPLGYFISLKAKRSAYVWRSIFAQHPTSAEGNLFHRADFRYWHRLAADPNRHGPLDGRRVNLINTTGDQVVHLDDCFRFITVDLAASRKTMSDWTVASVWAIWHGQLLLLDVGRDRIEERAHWQLVQPLVMKWQAPDVFIEKGFIGSTLVIDATKAGMRVQPVTPDADKVTRALPATHRIRAHTVFFPAGADFLDDVLDELAAFPAGINDDFVDTLSYAARITSAHWTETPPPRRPDATESAAEQAYASATGGGQLDLSRADW